MASGLRLGRSAVFKELEILSAGMPARLSKVACASEDLKC